MRFAGEFAALGTAACWAASANFFAAAAARMGPVILNRLRITAAAVLLVLVLTALRGSPWPVWASRPAVLWLALSGVTGFVFGDTWQFRSIVELGPGRASLLASTAPVFTVLLAWPLLREHPGPLALLGMALTLAGIAWVLRERARGAAAAARGRVGAGVVAGLLGALGQAGGYVFSTRALRTGLDPLSATVVRVVAATAAIWALAALERAVPVTLAALRDRGGRAFMLGGAVFGPFLGVLLSLTALQRIPAGVAASITAFAPVFAMLMAARFHAERLMLRSLAGALVAVGGVIVLFLR